MDAIVTGGSLDVSRTPVTACGLDGGVAALPYLARVLAQDDPSVRPLALDALGKIGGPTARALVEGVASDPQASRTERVFARAALDTMQS